MNRVSQTQDEYLHHKLPIGSDEKVIGVYKHHIFAYIVPWLLAFVVILALFILAALLTATAGNGANSVLPVGSKMVAYGFVGILSLLVAVFAYIPMYLRSQEQLVLTDEAILQVLHPSLFADKVSQLSLQHVADVSVRQDFWGNMFGFGAVTIETPGEQANYSFTMVPEPHQAAKEIIEAHENFVAALESGRLPTNIRRDEQDEHSVQVDAKQYQEFLNYQQYQAQARQESASPPQAPAKPNDISRH